MSATAAGTQLLTLPAGFLPAFRRALEQGRDPLEAAVLLRQVGYETGESFHAALEEWLSREGGDVPGGLPPEEFWSAFGRFWESLGWGTVRHVQLHPGIAALDCEGWVEADSAGATGQPVCHVTTGVLADLLGRLAGSGVAVMEVECRSAGDQRCRFLFGGEAALGEVYRGMTEGLPYPDALSRLG